MSLGGVGGSEFVGFMRSGDGLFRMVRRLFLDSCGDSVSRGFGSWFMVWLRGRVGFGF